MRDGGPPPFPKPYPVAAYGRRRGRKLRPGRLATLHTLLPRLRVSLTEGSETLDPAELFDRPVTDVFLEIGFGSGEHLAALATAHPDAGVIGCEIFVNGIARTLARVAEAGLTNVRIFDDDARLLLARLAPASLARVFLLFPDPWPKGRHHQRRFIGPDTVAALAKALRDGGEVRVATDHEGYARWALAHLAAEESLVPAGGARGRPAAAGGAGLGASVPSPLPRPALPVGGHAPPAFPSALPLTGPATEPRDTGAKGLPADAARGGGIDLAAWRQRPADAFPTRYETKARAQGRPCFYLVLRKYTV